MKFTSWDSPETNQRTFQFVIDLDELDFLDQRIYFMLKNWNEDNTVADAALYVHLIAFWLEESSK